MELLCRLSFFFHEEGAALTSLSDPPAPGLGFQACPLARI